jgi:hypothetical protein
MAASLASFASILKEFYLGPIQDQLNNETLVCDLFEKASVDWNGRQVIIPCHVGRNQNVGWRGEGAPLPGPAFGALSVGVVGNQQAYVNLTLTAQFLYGRFQITGPAMASAGKGGANSFVGWVDGEMNKLVNDIKNNCNRTATSGGRVIGFVTHLTQFTPGGGPQVVTFDGDVTKANALVGIGALATGHVRLIRMDTYADQSVGGVGGTLDITAVGAGTLTLNPLVGDTPGIGNFPVEAGAGSPLVPSAVVLTDTAAAALAALAVPQDPDQEPVGIYGNLGLPGDTGIGAAYAGAQWFNTDRTTVGGAATGADTLQCTDGTGTTTSSNIVSFNVADNTRIALAPLQIQSVLDQITLASDSEPDVILCNPLQRTRLAQMAAAVNVLNLNPGAASNRVADQGYTGWAFGGIPVKTSRHVDNGMMIFLTTKAWKMCELESGKFADEDGDVLSRVGITDAYEGFYKWYYNLVCTQPNRNGVLTGLVL